MLLSLQHGYLFVANQKIGSESLHLLGGEDCEIAFSRIGVNKHDKLPQFAEIFANAGLNIPFDNLFCFSIIREPAEWYVSWYNSRARAPLANPQHRRHAVYTGNYEFDEYLELAKREPKNPAAKVQPQFSFFKNYPDGRINAIPFEEAGASFATLFPRSQLGTFEAVRTKYKINKSKIVRFTSDQLTKEQRKLINEELFPRDYKLYLKAKSKIQKLAKTKVDGVDGVELIQRIESDEKLKLFAEETAFSHAQSLLFRDSPLDAVRSVLTPYKFVDIESLLDEAQRRVERLKIEANT